jgi:hypothetical protein
MTCYIFPVEVEPTGFLEGQGQGFRSPGRPSPIVEGAGEVPDRFGQEFGSGFGAPEESVGDGFTDDLVS